MLAMHAALFAVSLVLAAAQGRGPLQRGQAGLGAVEPYLEACETFGWSGVALVARGDEVVLHRGYGLADREAGVPNGPGTAFEIASATKPFTACAVLALVEEGKLELDRSIADYLPGVPEDKRGITVRHLLAHTSGMPRSAGGGAGDDLALAVRGYLSSSLVREPGARHEYWNGGYALLAGIVEEVTEEGYRDHCARRLFARAGLRATGFAGDTLWPASEQAVGYAGGTPVRRAAEHAYGGALGYQYRGMGGMVTTAEELWKLARAIQAGKILRPETVAEMLTAVDGSYGLGWGRTTTKRGTTRFGHGGDVRGFHAQMQLFPDEGVAVVLLSNVDEVPLWQLAWNVEALLLGPAPAYPLPPAILAVAPEALARCAGDYALGGAKGRVTVRPTERGLELAGDGLAARALLAGSAPPTEAESTLASMAALIEAVAAGDPGPAEALLADHVPKGWPRMLTSRIYPLHAETWGALREITPVDFAQPRPGAAEAVFALEHEHGRAHVRILYTAGRLSIFDLKAGAPDATWRFAPAAEGARRGQPLRFVTHRWEAVPARADAAGTPLLRFEPARGAVKTLVLERSGSPAARLRRVE